MTKRYEYELYVWAALLMISRFYEPSAPWIVAPVAGLLAGAALAARKERKREGRD